MTTKAYVGTTVMQVRVGTAQTNPIIGAGPGSLVYVGLPFITGNAFETALLTVHDGTVTGAAPISFSYEWLSDGVPIPTLPLFLEDPELELV